MFTKLTAVSVVKTLQLLKMKFSPPAKAML